VRELLAEQFPRLDIDQLVVLQTGGDHYTAAVNDDLIFRFPRDADTAAKTQREIRLLAALAPSLPLPIPAVVYVGRPGKRFPFAFTGQRRIAGVMGELLRPPREHWPSLARQAGVFFSALHAFPPERALALGLSAPQPEPASELVAEVGSYADDLRRFLLDMAADPSRSRRLRQRWSPATRTSKASTCSSQPTARGSRASSIGATPRCATRRTILATC